MSSISPSRPPPAPLASQGAQPRAQSPALGASQDLRVDGQRVAPVPPSPGVAAALGVQPKLSPLGRPERLGGEALAAQVAPALHHLLATARFDSTSMVDAFLQHAETPDGRIPDVGAAFGSWRIDSLRHIEAVGVGQCVALARKLGADLQATGVNASVVASQSYRRVPGEPRLGHAATVVPFASPAQPDDHGHVLLIPGLLLHAPLVVRPGRPCDVHFGKERWRFEERPDATGGVSIAWHSLDHSRDYGTNPMQRFDNADEAVTKQFIATDPTPQIIVRDPQGHLTARLQVKLDEATLEATWSSGAGTCALPLHALQDPQGAEAQQVRAFAAPFDADPNALVSRVARIARHSAQLNALRAQSLAFRAGLQPEG